MAFQVEFNGNNIKNSEGHAHFIYTFDSKRVLKRISTKGVQDDFDYNVDVVINLIAHPGISKIASYLEHTNWSKVMLHEKGIIALQ